MNRCCTTSVLLACVTSLLAQSNCSAAEQRPGFVGTEVCAQCHGDQHQSYLKTLHSKSLREIVLADEVATSFSHDASHSSFEVTKKEDKLWHRQWRHFDGQDKMLVDEFPMQYVMGSGAFAKGYLATEGKYLLQSPVTWYQGAKNYGMSPGYDLSQHLGFKRNVTDKCLFCHAGSVSRLEDNPNFFTIHELAIGCERCHGPGEEHTKLYRSIANGTSDKKASVLPETAIIHPGKLSRAASESICSQCHAQGEVSVSWSGKTDWDFVPGEDFAATKINFNSVLHEKSTGAFVGHFSQMRESVCYQKSDTLTCITCHDPHINTPESAGLRHQLFREQCLTCHTDQACGIDRQERVQTHENRCAACHMPTMPTEVPHTATTNHRIAIHSSGQSQSTPETKYIKVLPIQDPPNGAADHEMERMTAIATLQWMASTPEGARWMPQLAPKIGQQLDSLVERGHGDPDIYAALAMLTKNHVEMIPINDGTAETRKGLWTWANGYAEAATTREPKPVESRVFALDVIAQKHLQQGEFGPAIEFFEELTRVRRNVSDWYGLGVSYAQTNQLAKSESAFRKAIEIDRIDPNSYQALSQVLLANPNRTKEQQSEADALSETANKLMKIQPPL